MSTPVPTIVERSRIDAGAPSATPRVQPTRLVVPARDGLLVIASR